MKHRMPRRARTGALLAFLIFALLLIGSSLELAAQQKDPPTEDKEFDVRTLLPPGVGNNREPAEEAETGDRLELKGKWIVRFVKRDGKPNAAQIGQKIGDIITMKKDGNQFAFG